MMKLNIDTDANYLSAEIQGVSKVVELYSKEGLRLLSQLWLKVEWNELHWQSISWLGFPIWQLPEDLLRLQEVIFRIQPDIIVETGINQAGSAIFFASLCRLLGKGRVVSIDIQVPEAVRTLVTNSPYSNLITLIEGDSASSGVVTQVRKITRDMQTTFFFLDSDHSKAHVTRELNAYAEMVTVGSYIVATDGVMRILSDVPKGLSKWRDDNPASAALEFANVNKNFVIERPKSLFGDDYVIEGYTYWPDAWLKRIS